MQGLLNTSTNTADLKNDKCDKYDYLTAVAAGAVAGIVDIFFVGSPLENTKLMQWTDAQTDNFVKGFAKLKGWKPRAGKENNLQSAIGFLEKKYPVNYDQANGAAVGNLFKMGTTNHHMKSLAHSPSIVGLFFSVVNQFTGTSSFLSNGQLITIAADGELQGGNFPAKLFAATANWIGHLVSDVAGSSGATKRGSGIVAPFYELFGLCNFGEFKIIERNGRPNLVLLSQLAVRAFQEGYDMRFAMTMAIPVLISDLLTRLIWAIRQRFQYKRPLIECVPISLKHADLRVMLLISNGVLCLIDGADAAIRSGGDWLQFFLRLNLVAWCRFFVLVIKEVLIRTGLAAKIDAPLLQLQRAGEMINQYLYELERIDKALFEQETRAWNKMVHSLSSVGSQTELNRSLKQIYTQMGLALPYTGDFDTFMSNRHNRLEFK